jgi:two-component system, NarL family, invasion response regulator UvrY
MLRILLAYSHPIMKVAIKGLFKDYTPRVVFDEACDGDSVFEKTQETEYDLVILDVTMPELGAVNLVNNILKTKPRTKILMFSEQAADVYAKKYLQLGVMGYINKNALPVEIKKDVTRILNSKVKRPAAVK